MLATVHTFIGIVLALKLKNPWIALPTAFFSHFLLDIIPHWDVFTMCNVSEAHENITKEDKLKAVVDFLIGLTLGLVFVLRTASTNATLALTIFFAAALANLPDAIEAPYVFLGNKNPITVLIMRIQHILHNKEPLPWGIVTQIATVTLGLIVLAL